MLFHNQNVLVIGLGVSGRAAARYLLHRGACVWGTDQNREHLLKHAEVIQLKAEGLKALHENDPLPIENFSFIVVSPGVPPSNVVYQNAKLSGKEVIGEIELACRGLTQPCLAITGSNGKTTTTLLVEHVLNHTGRTARALGNVGVPLTTALEDSKECIVVLELSSWQLETLKTRVIDAGVVLNITPNHLDRHKTMEAYATAKLNLRYALKLGKPLFMGSHCYNAFRHLLRDSEAIPFGYNSNYPIYCDQEHILVHGKKIMRLPQKYRGRVSHDVENMMAAFALCQEVGVTGEEFLAAFKTFTKPPHRIQFIKKIKGVSYYDDSKGTSLDAVTKAVESMSGATFLIAGGVHKGAAYTPWLEAFSGKVKCVCAIGEAAVQIKKDLGHAIPVEVFSSLEEAVRYAASQAQNGENVLLSPGCASFDMFRDYAHRGDEFQRIILNEECL